MDQSELVRKAEIYVRQLYDENLRPVFVYHNLEHIENMVKAATKIADHYPLKEEDQAAVHIAAWFHDSGYLFVKKEHEEKSAELAELYLIEEKVDQTLIEKVRECILATKIFSVPTSPIAKIVADADLFHLGTNEFWRNNLKMREEMELRFSKKISAVRWQKGTLKLMEQHHFHTDYCQNFLQKGKEENIRLLRMRLNENERKRPGS